MKKILIIILSILLTILIALFVYFAINRKNYDNASIPDGYIAVFNGSGIEFVNRTYIYKIDNGESNYGFRYINTTEHTESWGSNNWIIEVTGRGEVMWTEEVFPIAQSNNADSYVTIPGSNKELTLEEFAMGFLLN